MILNHSKTIRSVTSLLCSRYCYGNAQYGYNTSYCFIVKLLHAAQNSAFKNHPRDILCDQNHFYEIVLAHVIHKYTKNFN